MGRGWRVAGWTAVALAAGVLIVAVWGFQTGVCSDSPDPSASGCASGPAVGLPAAWVLTVAAIVVIGYAGRRAVGALHGGGRPGDAAVSP